MSGVDDVQQQSELLVMDYLRTSRCMKTMDALSKWISDKSKKKQRSASSPTASDIFAKDVAANKSNKERANSVLEYMIGMRKTSPKSPKVSCSPEGAVKVNETTAATTPTSSTSAEWTKADLAKLKKEAKKTQHITDKTERWKIVGAALGRSKRECHDKYKEMRKKSKEKVAKCTDDDPIMLDLTDNAIAEAPTPRNSVNVQVAQSVKERTPSAKKYKHKVDVMAREDDSWCSSAGDTKPKGRAGAVVAPGDISSVRRVDRRKDDGDAVVEDCEDLDNIIDIRLTMKKEPPAPPGPVKGKLLPSADVAALRKLLFNDPQKKLSTHWTKQASLFLLVVLQALMECCQGFSFSTVEGLRYGIIQHEGGPCGVMAVVQAYVLYYLFKEDSATWQDASSDQMQSALVLALTHIIWQAANGLTCKIALEGTPPALEHILVSQLNSRHELEKFITVHIRDYADPTGYGVVLLVASVILSRGISVIEADMDSPDGTTPTLIGAHDYCTQEMVNLLLLGYACSNVFDGSKDLSEDGKTGEGSGMVLRGVQRPNLVGFLTLFEAYDYMVVGDHLKQPHDNIWVVCSESHYSVFFADPAAPALDNTSTFDLFYFDGLANQDEVIRLTVDPQGLPSKPEIAQPKDLIPPLNLVIQTKWPCATIDWNGVEPLL
ncbi:hypothetical protein AC1031_002889 [Aphanomyces cochlioides]|nr:hypothetical protein AC1031_002889 [Aphanomyces cochlioides]